MFIKRSLVYEKFMKEFSAILGGIAYSVVKVLLTFIIFKIERITHDWAG